MIAICVPETTQDVADGTQTTIMYGQPFSSSWPPPRENIAEAVAHPAR
jgi:hypothetical protein